MDGADTSFGYFPLNSSKRKKVDFSARKLTNPAKTHRSPKSRSKYRGGVVDDHYNCLNSSSIDELGNW